MKDEGDGLVNDLITSKPMNGREFEHAFTHGKACMLKEKRLMEIFMAHIGSVKGQQRQRLDEMKRARNEN